MDWLATADDGKPAGGGEQLEAAAEPQVPAEPEGGGAAVRRIP
jgi:hypothetical protein